MHKKYKKYCTIHNTDTVAYATHSGSYSTEHKKEVNYKLVHMWYTAITAVHSIPNSAQHIHDTEIFGLSKGQVASTMISVLIILSSTLTSQC